MSYSKQTWETGDTITADKLNHMEDGIANAGSGGGGGGGSGAFVVTFDITNDGGFVVTCDKTASEIISAYSDGLVCASISFFGESIYRHTFDVVADADTNYIEFDGIYVINDADEDHNGLLLNYSIVWDNESEMWNVDAVQYPIAPLPIE